jgi:hypothetical protein
MDNDLTSSFKINSTDKILSSDNFGTIWQLSTNDPTSFVEFMIMKKEGSKFFCSSFNKIESLSEKSLYKIHLSFFRTLFSGTFTKSGYEFITISYLMNDYFSICEHKNNHSKDLLMKDSKTMITSNLKILLMNFLSYYFFTIFKNDFGKSHLGLLHIFMNIIYIRQVIHLCQEIDTAFLQSHFKEIRQSSNKNTQVSSLTSSNLKHRKEKIQQRLRACFIPFILTQKELTYCVELVLNSNKITEKLFETLIRFGSQRFYIFSKSEIQEMKKDITSLNEHFFNLFPKARIKQ